MEDDKGNSWTFTDYYLRTVTDPDGNKIQINYSSGKITSIVQANKGSVAVTVATFAYDGNNLLSVTDAAGVVYTLTHSSNKLTSIKRGTDVIATYGYSGYRLNLLTDTESGYALAFGYTGGKVSVYQERGGESVGDRVAVTYPNHSQTTYRDHGNDRSKPVDDILTHYLFDYAERTINVYSTDNANNILGASNAAYSGTGSTDKKNNRTMQSSSVGVAAQQLVRDTSFENNVGWIYEGNAAVTTAKARTGLQSVSGTSDSTATQQSVRRGTESLTEGNTYTFSAYVNTSELTEVSSSGIYLRVSDSANHHYYSRHINYITDANVDGGWVRISVTFTAQVTGAHTVRIFRSGVKGRFYVDDVQLEAGDAPSSYNMVENGSMEISSYGWTLGSSAAYSTAAGVGASAKSIKIIGDPLDTTTRAHQDIKANLPAGETYVLSGWVMANAVPDNVNTASNPAEDKEKQCGLRLALYFTDGSKEVFYVPFNPDLSGWQFVSYPIVAKKTSGTVERIRIILGYEKNANIAYFDNISLVREAAQTMKYDDDGNLVSVTTTGLSADTNTYSGGNLIRTVTGGSGTYDYTYDTTYTHRLKSVTNGLVTQTMGYDGTGNVTSTTLTGSGDLSITTSAVYGGSKNRLTSVTDATGATVSYGYGDAHSQMRGQPTAITDPAGTKTLYSYDDLGRTTETSIANKAKVAYTYGSGDLEKVERTDIPNTKTQTYNFTYDAFGNMKTAKVGTRLLASYDYFTGNGQLETLTYGNGADVDYTYDALGRTKTVKYSNERTLTYAYNGEGQLHSITDTRTGSTAVQHLYTYDSLGRLISSEKLIGETPELRTSQSYDEHNRVVSRAWQLPNSAYNEQYTYDADDGKLTTLRSGTGRTVTMTYDDLERLTGMSGTSTGRTYVYRDISDTQTTTQIASISYTDMNTPLTYRYTYDERGNFKTIVDPLQGSKEYTYDAQNQLTKETIGSATYTYSYDNAGNILTATNSTGSHTYTYGNSEWRDLLTAYDGQPITYDAIGNPTSYYNGTAWNFTWANGRQLTTASNDTNNISYTYGADGLRTSKTVDGVLYTYCYEGGKLVRMTIGDTTTMDFFYDQYGRPFAMKHNTRILYYVLNAQGDVTRLIHGNGDGYATYYYDAWGNITYATDNEFTRDNPLRYRGYVYDEETQLYYCQSRYYDPALGRFINADAFASTGQGIIGNNMFAYCGNSPVSYVDPSGYLFVPYDTLPGWTEDPSENSSPESRQSLGEIEITVLKAKGISVYNGVPVIKLPFGGDVGFSAGVIFLGDGVPANENGISMLKHEYGHVVHLSQIGWESYVTWVIIPSVINYHKGVKYADYYSQPWEYIADKLGGVERANGDAPYVYKPDAKDGARKYWQFTYEYVGVYPNS